MKIRYDGSGNINAVAVNAVNLTGATVVTLPDNADVMNNVNKYMYVGGNLVLRKYVKLTTGASLVGGIPSEPANGTSVLAVTITAYTPAGAIDTAANYAVILNDVNARPVGAPQSITLVNGVATVNFTSAVSKKMVLLAQAAGVFGDMLRCQFTQVS